MIKQVIPFLIADERDLPLEFADNVAPSDRVYRTATGYIILSADDDAPTGADALGSVDEML